MGKNCQVGWWYASSYADAKLFLGYLRFPWENALPFLHAVTSKRIEGKGWVVAIGTIFYAVPPPDKKELWYQAGVGFQVFHEVHLVMCELDHLQRIPLALLCRVVKIEGQLRWPLELSSLPGWAVGQTEKTNGFRSIRVALWVTWAQRTGRSSSNTSINANKGNLCLNEMFSPPPPCIF